MPNIALPALLFEFSDTLANFGSPRIKPGDSFSRLFPLARELVANFFACI